MPVVVEGEPAQMLTLPSSSASLAVEALVREIPRTSPLMSRVLKMAPTSLLADVKLPAGVTTELPADEVVVVKARSRRSRGRRGQRGGCRRGWQNVPAA